MGKPQGLLKPLFSALDRRNLLNATALTPASNAVRRKISAMLRPAWAAEIGSNAGQVAKAIKPYWVSEQRGEAWTRLGYTLGISTAQASLAMVFNQLLMQTTDAITHYNVPPLLIAMTMGAAAGAFCAGKLGLSMARTMELKWWAWHTGKTLNGWLDPYSQTYARMKEDDSPVDNPESRIADSSFEFFKSTVNFGVGIYNTLLNIGLFSYVLWSQPGNLWAAAIGYAAVSLAATHALGKALPALHKSFQERIATYRSAMTAVRINAEVIAKTHTEREENGTLKKYFNRVAENLLSIIKTESYLSGFSSACQQLSVFVPMLLCAPFIKEGTMSIASMVQSGDAFRQIQSLPSLIMAIYSDMSKWISNAVRINEFADEIETRQAAFRSPERYRAELEKARAGINAQLDNPAPP